MSQQKPCGTKPNAAESEPKATNLVRLARGRVFDACLPIKPGEGVGVQISNAAKRLQLAFAVTWRGWYLRASARDRQEIDRAYRQLVLRRNAEFSQRLDSAETKIEALNDALLAATPALPLPAGDGGNQLRPRRKRGT